MSRKWKQSTINKQEIAQEVDKNTKFVKMIDEYKVEISKLRENIQVTLNDLGLSGEKDGYFAKNILIEDSIILAEKKENIDKAYSLISKIMNERDFQKMFPKTLADELFSQEFINFAKKAYKYKNHYYSNLDIYFKNLEDFLQEKNIEADRKYISMIENINKFHDQYEKVLALDKREEENSIKKDESEELSSPAFMSRMKSMLGDFNWFGINKKEEAPASKPTFDKKAKEIPEEEPSIIDSTMDWIFGNNKNQKPAPTTDIKSKPVTEEKVVEIKENVVSKELSTNHVFVSTDSTDVTNKIHESFISYANAMVDTAKAGCFSRVIQKQKLLSNCLVKKPGMSVEEMKDKSCDALAKQAEIALDNCMNLFPMGTNHDTQISDYLKKSATMQVEVNEGNMAFHTHDHIELFQLVYNSYSEDAVSDALQLAYNQTSGEKVNLIGMADQEQ